MIGFDIRNIHTKDYETIKKLNSNFDYKKVKVNKGDKNFIAYVAQLNDEVVGYAICHTLNENDYNEVMDIDDIVVNKMYRGLGVGHQLMIEVEKTAKDHKVNYIIKSDDNYDEEGGDFLRREGFKYSNEGGYEKKVLFNKEKE